MMRRLIGSIACPAAVAIFVSLAPHSSTAPTTASSTVVERAVEPTAVSTRRPSDDPARNQRDRILGEVHQVAAAYAALVAHEESHSSIRPGTPSAGEIPPFQQLEPSADPLYRAWGDALDQIQRLNEEYASISRPALDPAAYRAADPRPNSQEDLQALIDAAGIDYVSWFEGEQRTGFTVVLYDPYERRSQAILIGDSYAEERLRWAALLEYRLDLLAPPEGEREAEIETIRRVVSAEARLEDVGRLLPVYTDHLLHLYRAGDWRVNFDPVDHQIVVIYTEARAGTRHRVQSAGDAAGTLTTDELEQRAQDLVQLAAPDIDLGGLTPVRNQKGDNFFFRWEDRTRPLLPDGRSYPFIQVALSAGGELLNFYNTL